MPEIVKAKCQRGPEPMPQRRALDCRRSDAAHPDTVGYAVPAEGTCQRALDTVDHIASSHSSSSGSTRNWGPCRTT